MALKSYNSDEEKYSNLINLLQSLPQEKAPDNFEFNLFTKIRNGNFSLNTKKELKFEIPAWVYAPFAALVLSAVVFFVVVDVENFNLQQPLSSERMVNTVKVTHKESNPKIKAVLVPNPRYRVVINQNDAVVKEKVPIPISPEKSVYLDSYLTGEKATANKGNLNRLVSEKANFFRFDGFMPVVNDFQSINQLRARIDSIRKMWERKRLKSVK